MQRKADSLAKEMRRREEAAMARFGHRPPEPVPPPQFGGPGAAPGWTPGAGGGGQVPGGTPGWAPFMNSGSGGSGAGAGAGAGGAEAGELRRFPLLWCTFAGVNVISMILSAFYLTEDEEEIKECVRLAKSSFGGRGTNREKQLAVSKSG